MNCWMWLLPASAFEREEYLPPTTALSGKCLESDRRGRVGHARDRLNIAGDEMADIRIIGQIALHEQVKLPRCRMDLGDLINVQRRVIGDVIGLTQFAFHLNEDRLHCAPVTL